MKLYSIKNIQTNRFNPPFVARDNDDAIETCRKAIIVGRDISLLVELKNLVLIHVGAFDAITGNFYDDEDCSGVETPYPVCALQDIPLPEHVQELIDKLKKVEKDVDANGIKSFFYKLLSKVDKKQNKKKASTEEVAEEEVKE